MSYKSILVYLDDSKSNPEKIQLTLEIAKSHKAHVTGAAFASLKPEKLISDSDQVIELECKRLAESLTKEFEEEAGMAGVEFDSMIISGNSDESTNHLAHTGRNSDLIVLPQPNPDSRNYRRILNMAEEVMLLSGRPILFMPYIGANNIPFKRAMISWDGTPAATRATYDAIPLLKRCDRVKIMVVESKKQLTSKGDAQAEELSRQLKRHGVNSFVEKITPGNAYVANIILNEISERNKDLLVMGGYGTPTLKQKIMGGVTSSLLSTMLIPVLMAH